jgi:iron complex transport system substrate-binding protein
VTARRRVAALGLLAGVLAAASGCRETARQSVDSAAAGPASGSGVRRVTDMRGVVVTVPAPLTRVATIDDGFVEGVMTRLGVVRTVVGVASDSLNRTWSYSYPAPGGRSFAVADGMGTMRALHPWMADLPCASCGGGDAISYETIATTRPEVVVLRVGDCTIGTSPEVVARTVEVLGAMGIPAVVLRSPADYRGRGLESLRAEIDVLGRLFGREREATALSDELSAAEATVRTRVQDVTDAERPRVLYLGLASGARSSGGAAYVWGVDTNESWMIERIVGARNAYRGPGARVLLNAEQILALDPDVIFLPTSAGYHPPSELIEAPYFRELQRLRAVREKRVYALPWTPENCARRLEYPIDLVIMAKGAYPDRFRDMAVDQWALEFYQRIYGIDEVQAAALLRAQWLDGTVDAGF